MRLLDDTAEAVRVALAGDLAGQPDGRRDRGERPGQYRIDLVADEAALGVLRAAGVGVLSEESGLEDATNDIVVVLDPVDGSTNASRGIPWYATSLCAVDRDGPRAALVVNLATGTRYQAVRGVGATARRSPDPALVGSHGAPGPAGAERLRADHLGWRQYRSLGATALDLCSVADGTVDGSIDWSDSLGPWDYLGAMLVVHEAGGQMSDGHGRELVVLEHSARRTLVAAGTPELFEQLLVARSDAP